jgi:hypothetical protein
MTVPRLLHTRATLLRSSRLSRQNNPRMTILPTKLSNTPVLRARVFGASAFKSANGPKTYFQRGDSHDPDKAAIEPPEYNSFVPRGPINSVRNEVPNPTPETQTKARAGLLRRLFRIAVVLGGGYTAFQIYAGLALAGVLPGGAQLYQFRESLQHARDSSGTMELFSLLLLHILNTGTLWDAYRDDDLLLTERLVLEDGTPATPDNATLLRVVDAAGRTRMIILAVDVEENPDSWMASWASQTTRIQTWLLHLSNKIYSEANGTEVGLSLVYFTRDTMGIGKAWCSPAVLSVELIPTGPVGKDGTPPLMHCYKYDAASEGGFGNMYELLKQVKTEPEPLTTDEDVDGSEGGGTSGSGEVGSDDGKGDGDSKKDDLPTPLQVELGGWNH